MNNPWAENVNSPNVQSINTPLAQSIYRSAADAIKSDNIQELVDSIEEFTRNYGPPDNLLKALIGVAIEYQNKEAVGTLLKHGYNKSWTINFNHDGRTMITAHEAAKIQKTHYNTHGYSSVDLEPIITMLNPHAGGKRNSRRNKRKNNKSRKQYHRRR